ncbi:hypothetical protein CSUI_006671, partial [Cystoisospora suis]
LSSDSFTLAILNGCSSDLLLSAFGVVVLGLRFGALFLGVVAGSSSSSSEVRTNGILSLGSFPFVVPFLSALGVVHMRFGSSSSGTIGSFLGSAIVSFVSLHCPPVCSVFGGCCSGLLKEN